MKNSNTILEMMVSHHALIEVLFLAFKDSLEKDIERAENFYEEFRWELEKHFFVEEKVVFKPCEKMKSDICQTAMHLVKEHDLMLEMLNKAKEVLSLKSQIDIAEFQTLLKTHRETEEKILYPKLDQELNSIEKEIILARINEIPLTETEADLL